MARPPAPRGPIAQYGLVLLWAAGLGIGMFVLAAPFAPRELFPDFNYSDVAPFLAGLSILLVAFALSFDLAARHVSRLLAAAGALHFAGQASVLVGLWHISGCWAIGPCVFAIYAFLVAGLGFGGSSIVLAAFEFANRGPVRPAATRN